MVDSNPEPGDSILNTFGFGCIVLHQRTEKWTIGTSRNPTIPRTAANLALWDPSGA